MTTHTGERRSIPTRYKNIRFRSKLEADYARAFDALGIEWQYEKEGRYFGDVFYLPDFWLPKSRQFVEVKGVFEPDDCRKIHALIRHTARRPFTGENTPDVPIVAMLPGGQFHGWRRTDVPRNIACRQGWADFLIKDATDCALFSCARCHGWWFADEAMSWACQCCGAYDGNSHLSVTIRSPLPAFPDLHELRGLGFRTRRRGASSCDSISPF